MMTKEQTQALANKILSFSKFPHCSVSISESEQAQVRFANNGITTAGFTVERTVSIASTKDRKTGEVDTTEMDDASLRAAVARSEEMAAISPVNAEYIEPPGSLQYPNIEAWDEDTATARGPVMIPHVRAVIQYASKRKLIAAGFFQRRAQVAVRANKQGLFGYHRSTGASLSTTVRAADGSSSGWAGQPSPRIREIDGALLAETAVEKCLRWKGPRRLEPGKYTVVLEATAVGDLVARMALGFNARAAEEGRSFLSKKGGGTLLGEKLFPESVTLVSDPFDRRIYGMPWGPGGELNARITWIEKGVVRNLAYDRYWAAKSGRQATPPPASLILEGSSATRDDLIRSVERGLLVTRFWYIRPVNQQTLQQTGLTRDGLFLIEGGKISVAVMNFRFNESPVRLLQNALKFGMPTRVQGGEGSGMVVPPMVAREFTFTSISDAV